MEAKEIFITIKDEESTLKLKFLIYEDFTLSEKDPVIANCIKKAVEDFGKEPDKIRIRCSLDIF